MNKALILLLVTLVQSQSNGVVLSNDGFQDTQLEDWDTTGASYPMDIIKDFNSNPQKTFRKRLVTSDAFTRRSTLDKNFMRFGRGGGALQGLCGRGHSDGKLSFHRFGRGLKDNFIRFGRAGDNFIRFGRGIGKDGFIRFGKAASDDFFRAGKSLRENFIRFGKADENFKRFGREFTDEYCQDFFSSEEPFQRMEQFSKDQDNFLRPGKSGKHGTNFLRFGKSNAESDDGNEINQDFIVPKQVKRKRRNTQEKPSASSKNKRKRSTRFFEMSPNDFPKKVPPIFEVSTRNLEDLKNSRLTPFYPVYLNFPKSFDFYDVETKRNQGGSYFIRFG